VSDVNSKKEQPSIEDLSQIKQYLISIAKDILINRKMDYLYPLELLSIAKKDRKYSESELFQSISELYDEKFIVPDEHLTKDMVLETLDHSDVYNFIRAHPSCDTLDIMMGLHISFRRALRNLQTLFKFGFIRARVHFWFYLYYPIEAPVHLDLVYRFGKINTTRKILEYFLGQESVSALELAQALNMSYDFIQQKLKRLIKAQILSQDPIEPSKYQMDLNTKESCQKILDSLAPSSSDRI